MPLTRGRQPAFARPYTSHIRMTALRRSRIFLSLRASGVDKIEANSYSVPMSYTTEELIDFLDQELRAAWRGERVVLSSSQRLDPVIAKAIGTEKLSKVFAVQDFRDQIHQYQREHLVSGLVWHTCRFQGRSHRFPELHPQLIATAQDKAAIAVTAINIAGFVNLEVNAGMAEGGRAIAGAATNAARAIAADAAFINKGDFAFESAHRRCE